MNRILVIKAGALGDLIAGTTAINALKRVFPSAQISALASPLMREIAPPGTLVDEILPFPDSPRSYFAAIRTLRSRRFDAAVNLRWSSEGAALLARLSGAQEVLGSGPTIGRWLYTRKAPQFPGRRHEFLRHLDIVASLGVAVGEPEPFVYRSAEDSAFAARLFGTGRTATVVVLHPGASNASKAWMPERYAELGRRIAVQLGARLIVTWGPGEEELAAAVAREIGPGAQLGPATTIGQLAAVVGQAALCVCNYSGVMNIAMAVRTPLVALGCTSAKDWGPYGPLHRTVNAAGERDSYTAEERRAAMLSISVDAVWDAVERRYRELLEHPVELRAAR
jgi:ADP-heptose:LPS heptosyltransferase